jgi:hypothetical protein
VPHATIAIARWKQGVVAAVPVTASGDSWDDSGIMVGFFASPDATWPPTNTTRIVVGMPERISLAPLPDGSVVVAYGKTPTESLFGAVRVTEDGEQTFLGRPSLPHDGYTNLGAGPLVTAFDDGVAIAWTSFGTPNQSVVRLRLALSDGYSWINDGVAYDRENYGMRPDSTFALGASDVDRALHLAWEVPGTGAIGPVIRRQRFVCAFKGIR